MLRVVRTRLDPPRVPSPTGSARTAPEFFMDYRNADGSVAEMCGNGARVFVRYLLDRGLVELDGLSIATRAGSWPWPVPADGEPDDWITVDAGPGGLARRRPQRRRPGLAGPRPGVAVSMPNPHVVVFVDDPSWTPLDLTHAAVGRPPLPHGQNVEFVVRGDARAAHARARTGRRRDPLVRNRHRRGGVAAVAAAAGVGRADGDAATAPVRVGGDGRPWRVEVPGGVCAARWRADGHVVLSGPAVIVASSGARPGVDRAAARDLTSPPASASRRAAGDLRDRGLLRRNPVARRSPNLGPLPAMTAHATSYAADVHVPRLTSDRRLS